MIFVAAPCLVGRKSETQIRKHDRSHSNFEFGLNFAGKVRMWLLIFKVEFKFSNPRVPEEFGAPLRMSFVRHSGLFLSTECVYRFRLWQKIELMSTFMVSFTKILQLVEKKTIYSEWPLQPYKVFGHYQWSLARSIALVCLGTTNIKLMSRRKTNAVFQVFFFRFIPWRWKVYTFRCRGRFCRCSVNAHISVDWSACPSRVLQVFPVHNVQVSNSHADQPIGIERGDAQQRFALAHVFEGGDVFGEQKLLHQAKTSPI